MADRLFDKQNYSPKTLENFEIMSAYYVDIFYNHLYIEAKKLKATGNVASITEGYKHTLNAFLKGLDNPKLYKKSIVGMHHYFISIGYASISFAKCIDRLTKEFIPLDYFASLTVTQKMGVLRMVLNQSLKMFIKKIVDDHMAKIIDFHMEKDNVRILQDELIDCFILEREGMYQRFIAENTKTNKNETVNRLLAEKMQTEIKRLVREKYDQQKQILILKKIIMKRKNHDEKYKEIMGGLQSEISLLKQQKYQQQQQIDQQSMQYSEHQKEISNKFFQHQPTHTQPTQVQPTKVQPSHITVDVDQHNTPSDHVETHQENSPTASDAESYNDETIGDTNVSSFIEVNGNNIHNILEGDSDDLYKMHNTKMDGGTSLDDFN
jgi:hypothetical protein